MLLAKLGAGAAATAYGAGKYGTILAKSAFSKTVKTARTVFDSARVRKDVLVKGGRMLDGAGMATSRGTKRLGSGLKDYTSRPVANFGKAAWNKTPSMVRKGIVGGLKKTGAVAGISALGVGAVGMMSVGIMNGMNNSAKDILYERYMQDQRYSRNIMLQSRVGLAMGTNKMNRAGSTMGLSNALSKTRHGAQY